MVRRKKKEKKAEMLPQGKSPMGGDTWCSGKNTKDMLNPWVRVMTNPMRS